MKHAMGLYERAAGRSDAPAAFWHIGKGMAFFAGPLGRNALHSHSAAVLLAGLYGTFRLRIDGGSWQICRTAVVPPGVAYEFDLGGAPLGVLYLEPNAGRYDALAPMARSGREVNGALVASAGETRFLRELYETNASRENIGAALDDILGFSQRRARREMDKRIVRVIEELHSRFDTAVPIADLAQSVGLSPSRLQHLFAQEAGVPLRRYRTWQRLRAAIREVVAGSSLTQAAHAAGFYDQSHFAREFRRTFGAPASQGLTRPAIRGCR